MRLPFFLAFGMVVSACAGTSADLPLILRGTAPEAAFETASIERLPAASDLSALIEKYRVFAPDVPAGAGDLGDEAIWWLIVPPIQNSGGYRLHIASSGGAATACLSPPDGPAIMVLTSSAFLVALPTEVKTVNWDGPCNG